MIFYCRTCHKAICQHDNPMCASCSIELDEGNPETTLVLCTDCGGSYCMQCEEKECELHVEEFWRA